MSPGGHIDQCVANKQLPLITPRTKLGGQAQQSRGEPSRASSAHGRFLSLLQLEDVLNQQEKSRGIIGEGRVLVFNGLC